MTLLTRRLGRDGPSISPIGFGGWAIGGGDLKSAGWAPQDDRVSIRAIRRAVELGVNWIDTSPAYGFGHSEEVIGRALRDLGQGSRPLVFTKCGTRLDPPDSYRSVTDLRPDHIRGSCEESLRRLGVESIDVFQIHHPDDLTGTAVEESWAAMARLVEEGKVRYIGVSNFSVSQLERCERVRHVDTFQPPFSVIRRGAADELIPWCQAHGTGVIVYAPMHHGLLIDSFSVGQLDSLPVELRSRSDFQTPELEKNLSLRDSLRGVARQHGVDTGAVAVGWALSWPGVTGAIVGALSADQVNSWIPGATLKLSRRELDQIATAIERTGAGNGPPRPRVQADGPGPGSVG